MRITEHGTGFRIEHDDRTTETVSTFPDTFVRYHASIEEARGASESFYPLKKTGRKFATLDDFRDLLDLPALETLSLQPETWRGLYLFGLYQIHELLQNTSEGFPRSSDGAGPLMRVIEYFGERVYALWYELNACLGEEEYDLGGVKRRLGTLRTPEERIDFLHGIVEEMRAPFFARLVNFSNDRLFAPDGSDDALPSWGIGLIYRHALSPRDMARVRTLLRTLEANYPTDVMREAGILSDPIDVPSAAQDTAHKPGG